MTYLIVWLAGAWLTGTFLALGSMTMPAQPTVSFGHRIVRFLTCLVITGAWPITWVVIVFSWFRALLVR